MTTAQETPPAPEASKPSWFRMLLADPLAFIAAIVLLIVAFVAVFGRSIAGETATNGDLALSRLAPFSTDHGWQYFLGGDLLGRSLLGRLMVATQTTMSVSIPVVIISLVIGASVGMWAGYHRGWRETVAMRVADVVLSFPSLLMAVVVLYIFSPSIASIIAILAVTRIPIYLRTARAESAELQSRLFVDAARTFGTPSGAIIRRHIVPIVLPTLLTVATLDFCYVMLAESSLSFLGIGVQPPDVSWGLMVAQGRDQLRTQWWLSVLPGLAIVITTVSANLLASWARIASDPGQRWRLTTPRRRRAARPTIVLEKA
ncbi:ABC transporter permease [Actinoplanes derwentensis]|uniref:Peptide/nickel transport system permease protein n=1 Tax=Actinoplanes derwentensis TaxID=113562 RepID=A0A1H1TIQ7_9ACTN|nr:ABC transporter permease [Actinoplanes derwentensis]GID85044.1 ABC transporter permease [Actinoplanes derwentensis]SDS60133.1 peptide/nickel transport system permease protein [Actinoplanes derwentensis]